MFTVKHLSKPEANAAVVEKSFKTVDEALDYASQIMHQGLRYQPAVWRGDVVMYDTREVEREAIYREFGMKTFGH